jgi:hypothetical protein
MINKLGNKNIVSLLKYDEIQLQGNIKFKALFYNLV